MRHFKTILTITIFGLTISNAFAHKDRIERPKTYIFIFQDTDTIKLNNPSDSLLRIYSDDIINHRKKLIEAELLFETGEILTFKTDGSKWTSIIISDGKREITIPDTTIEKISGIHFATVALLWNGDYKKAFSANYFYIRFDLGTVKSFNEYPELHLSFSDHKFSKSIIWRQISENSKQWSDF